MRKKIMKVFRILIIISLLIELSSFCMEKSTIPTPPSLPQNEPKLQPPQPEQPSHIQTYLDKYKFEIGAGAVAVAAVTIPLVAKARAKNRAMRPTIK